MWVNVLHIARPRAEDTGLALDNSFLSPPLLTILITRSYLDPQLCSLRRNFGRVSAPTKTGKCKLDSWNGRQERSDDSLETSVFENRFGISSLFPSLRFRLRKEGGNGKKLGEKIDK